MNRTVTLAAITLVSALATPVVVNAMAPKAGPVVVVAAPKPEEASCARRVKVVYAGYGEGQAMRCGASVR